VGLALLSGLLLVLSFPKFGHPAFAWIALTPLIVAIARSPESAGSTRRAFLLGVAAGAVYFAGTLYWLVETMTTFGGLSTPLAIVAAGALVAYLALFPAAFAVIVMRVRRRIGLFAAIALAPAIWVSTELGRQYVWDGFPWELLGYSQITFLPIAQLASVTGVYGLSALIALVSAAIASGVLLQGRQRWVMIGAAAGLVAVCGLWGARRLGKADLTRTGEPVRVAVLQANIAQEDKWNPSLADAITDKHLMMTRQALGRGATFVLWPESSTPFYFEQDLVRGGAIRRLARESGATLLIGSDQVEPVRPAPRDEPAALYYNAAFLVKPDGDVGAVYRKMHLVPFGEYVPLKNILFFAGTIVEAVSDFTPGNMPVLLPVGSHVASTAICYEVIYGSLMREFVVEGSELLTTITNDAWYGTSSAAFQHWDQAAMRAIENGRYLARAANTGISGFVDPYGRVMEKTRLFEEAIVVGDLRFIKTRTIYSRLGDLVAWVCLALTIAALLASGRIVQARR
jgi:apolipoprotein N-acyltransferase